MVCEGKRPSDSVKSARSGVAERTISSKFGFLTHQCRVLKLVSMSNILFIFLSLITAHTLISLISWIFTNHQSKFFDLDLLRITQCLSHVVTRHWLSPTKVNKHCIIFQLLNLAPIFKFQNRINFPTPLKKCIHWQNLEQCGWGPWELIETFEIRVETKKN